MERRAINSSGKLCGFYDAYRDQLLSVNIETDSNLKVQWEEFPKTSTCELLTAGRISSADVLDMIGIEKELQISLLLNLLRRDGIAAVLDDPHVIHPNTRIMYYQFIQRTKVPHKRENIASRIAAMSFRTDATHLISSITYGIDLLVVFHLTSGSHSTQQTDQVLEVIRQHLLGDQANLNKLLNLIDNQLSTTIVHVYSNLPDLQGTQNMRYVLERIEEAKQRRSLCSPVVYALTPIHEILKRNAQSSRRFHPLNPDVQVCLQEYLNSSRSSIKELEIMIGDHSQKKTDSQSQKRLREAGRDLERVKDEYRPTLLELGKSVVDARKDSKASSELDRLLNSARDRPIEHKCQQIFGSLQFLQTSNIPSSSHVIHAGTSNHSYDARYASSNTEKIQNTVTSRWDGKPSEVLKNDVRPMSQSVSRAHRDRRQCECAQLHQVDPMSPPISKDKKTNSKMPSNEKKPECDQDSKRKSSPTPTSSSSLPNEKTETVEDSSSIRITQVQPINILLLGRTGVGRSTFINALANYLTFHSLQQALASEPLVLIPVSFIMTTGEDFQVQNITFGEQDSKKNEHFNDRGESVTDHCRSYTFALPLSKRQKIRIIDTPGFGDTRGIEQDQINIEHILQYIACFSHLDAICFLLKPNESRMDISFRTCFKQLFSLLGRTAHPNLIFCFTGSSSTFYAPGNTGPMLKGMIESLEDKGDIQFARANTFCFDNEAFRYLVAQRNGIRFTAEEQAEYKKSWIISVKESRRLIDYIENQLTMFRMDDGWQSYKHAQLQILSLVRPILETIRNLLRNALLRTETSEDQSIELTAHPIGGEARSCHSCFSSEQVGPFWIKKDDPHYWDDAACTSCECGADKHGPLMYRLEYQLRKRPFDDNAAEVDDVLQILCGVSASMARFLLLHHYSSNDDPFLLGLKQMMKEEEKLSRQQDSAMFNAKMVKRLKKVLEQYEEYRDRGQSRNTPIDLTQIYAVIKSANDHPMVKEQMNALRKTQKYLLEENDMTPLKI